MQTAIKIATWLFLMILGLEVFYAGPMAQKTERQLCWTTRVTRYVQHTVNPEDTLERIASLYGTTVTQILARNNMIPGDKLLIGEQLIIPVDGYKARLIL